MIFNEQELSRFIEQINTGYNSGDEFKDCERWSETVSFYRSEVAELKREIEHLESVIRGMEDNVRTHGGKQ